MRKLPAYIAGTVALFAALSFSVGALSDDRLYSKTAVLMEAESGQVLYDKGMHDLVYPASTTKIMTGLLVAELCDAREVLTVSESAVAIEEWNSTNIALVPGEQLTVADAMYAMMLHSANDVSNALAEHAAGSQEQFVEMMNQKAMEIGAYNTRFANAHGLHDPEHYTTSYDMALITRYAVQNSDFMRYFTQDYHTMGSTNLQPEARSFMNYQYMLLPDSYFYYPAAYGGKVGYTTEAQHTMSTIARKDGRTLISTVMYSGERTQKFVDTKTLFDYGFDEFVRISVPKSFFETGVIPANNGEISFTSDGDFTALVHQDVDLDSVQVQFDLPSAFTVDDRIPSYVEVTAKSPDGQTISLGYQSLVSDLIITELVLPVAEKPSLPPLIWGKSNETFTMTPMLLAILVLSGTLLILIGVLIARYKKLKRIRQAKLDRLGNRLGFPAGKSA